MILVDTSVWIDHLRRNDSMLAVALEAGQVLMHPFILGELACGTLANRAEVLALLGNLPAAPVATAGEALGYIERHRLMGRGIGYIDVHLLAATALADDATLWTRDKRLAVVAEALRLACPVAH
ncbi:type II toxin-antitoxin system VapC family toxin [Acidithiobacillus sulfuriphilus]|uniref:Ribonuclease VapC n=2 Tax=Acidithiobacillus sulfuriphilus TaxID=1867749 RepID=A0A3M8R692_9PROT|nr:PIN domain-containing protein [Acidithiobacillus sulfuriphilus]RNF64009.1 type II toxin-antitoxin system VapC family toxin [Acidithiobacillus sulfuriphilus]